MGWAIAMLPASGHSTQTVTGTEAPSGSAELVEIGEDLEVNVSLVREFDDIQDRLNSLVEYTGHFESSGNGLGVLLQPQTPTKIVLTLMRMNKFLILIGTTFWLQWIILLKMFNLFLLV